MTRLLAAALLFAAVAVTHADDKKKEVPAIADLAADKNDKIETKNGKATEPTAVKSEDDLKKAIPDEDTRTRIAKLVDFKEQTLLIFAWQGSGQDKLTYSVLESNPEQIVFTYAPGKTRDLRSHVHLYAVRNNVKWTAK